MKTLPSVAALLDSWCTTVARVDGRVALRSIRIDWSESELLQGKPVFPTFAAASVVLRRAAEEITGYIAKTQVTIEWADGATYKARIDLKRAAHGHLANVVGSHLRESCTFRSGRAAPSHLTADDYQRHLATAERFSPGSQDFCGRILDGYALDDGAPEVDGQPLKDAPKPEPTAEELRAKRGEGAKYDEKATLADIKRGVQADIKAAGQAGDLGVCRAIDALGRRAAAEIYDEVNPAA